MNKVRVVSAAVMMGLLVLAAGCGTGQSTAPSGGSSSSPSQSGSPESGGKTITIGYLAPMTGAFADLGSRPKAALEVLIKDTNDAGGIVLKDGSKATLKLVVGDDQGKIDVSGSSVRKLIESEKVDVVMGGMLSSIALATMDITEELKTPYIITGAIASQIGDKIRDKGYKYIFQSSPTSVQRATADLQSIQELTGAKNIYSISQDTDWGREMTEVAKAYMAKNVEGSKVTEEYVAPGTTQYSSQLLKMQQMKPDIIYASLIGQEIFSFMEQKSATGDKTIVFGSSSTPASDIYVKTLSEKADFTMMNLVWIPEGAGSLASDFAGKYKAVTGNSPADIEAQAYDGLLLLIDALKKADTIDKAGIAESLLKAEVTGLRGPNRFDPERHGVPNLSFVVGQIQNGKYMVVWPKNAANGDLARPK